jgi:hypothetical protein
MLKKEALPRDETLRLASHRDSLLKLYFSRYTLKRKTAPTTQTRPHTVYFSQIKATRHDVPACGRPAYATHGPTNTPLVFYYLSNLCGLAPGHFLPRVLRQG